MEGLKNFIINIKPTMLKVKNSEDLTQEDREKIVQFYLQVCDPFVLSNLCPTISTTISNHL